MSGADYDADLDPVPDGPGDPPPADLPNLSIPSTAPRNSGYTGPYGGMFHGDDIHHGIHGRFGIGHRRMPPMA